MPVHPGKKAADEYLVKRIQGASAELLAAMLLEGSQRFLNLVLQAMQQRDLPNQAKYINRTADILVGLKEQLNHDAGGELVENLDRIYDWWTNELFDGAQKNQPARLQLVASQMGEMRETWEELHRRKTSGEAPPQTPGPISEFSV